MDREDIIRMAREAGWDLVWGRTTVEQVMAFAEVVAAAERAACEAICEGYYDTHYAARAIRARGSK